MSEDARTTQHNWWRILTIVFVFGIIVLGLAVFIRGAYNGSSIFRQTESVDLQTLLDELVPTDAEIRNAFRVSVGSGAYDNEAATLSTRDAKTTHAFFSKPKGEGPFPVVIVVHGGYSSSRTTSDVAEETAEEFAKQLQSAVLVVDWRPATNEEEDVLDVVAALDWLDSISEIAEQPVILLGEGYGASLVLAALSEKTTASISGVVLVNPALDLGAHYEAMLAKNEIEADTLVEQLGCGGAAHAKRCIEQRSTPLSELDMAAVMIQSLLDSPLPEDQDIVESVFPQHTIQTVETSATVQNTQKQIIAWIAERITERGAEQGTEPQEPQQESANTNAASSETADTSDSTSSTSTRATPVPTPGGLGTANTIEEVELE